MTTMHSALSVLLSDSESTRSAREKLYMWFHQHPELSMQEYETTARLQQELDGVDCVLTKVGKTGFVAIVTNGEGPVVAARADFDGLPMKEESGKSYASTYTQKDETTGEITPTAHSCGHDFHLMSLLSAVRAFAEHKDQWRGTFVAVFQPGEETASGARDMVDHGLATIIPKPDVFLAQHVLGTIPGGTVGVKSGPLFSAAASIEITLHGVGSHGSMPQLGVDPIVLAAAIIQRLQGIVSREVTPGELAVVTVGSVHAGTKSNIIPDCATLQLNTRAFSTEVSDQLHAAIERIVRAECAASGAPQEPEFRYYDRYPLTTNDAEMSAIVRDAFDAYFGDNSVDMSVVSASEDFSILPDACGTPYVYWGLGGFARSDAPGNHSPEFAPDLQPTLDRGMEALIVAASAWLVPKDA